MDNVTVGKEQPGTASTSAQEEIIKDGNDNTTNESEQQENNAKLFVSIREKKSQQEKLEKIKQFLEKNPMPNINAQDGNDNGNTSLHMAVNRGYLEIVKFLLQNGAESTIEDNDHKTPLMLARELNNQEIITALVNHVPQARRSNNTADQQSAALLAQPIEQQSGRHEQHGNIVKVQVSDNDPQSGLSSNEEVSDILLPFSGELAVDTNLKLSHNDFKQSIQELGLTVKVTTKQLRAIPPYPTPYVLALFASQVYHGYKSNESERDYEKRLALPSGWKLLTTAFNRGSTNGYFGAAYWHPEHQHVVIAHRGTQFKNVGADWADLKRVVFNNYVPQMNSATTFADSVSRVLSKLNKKSGVNFQLFFTGHSLGGWLAQITTFTTEYLHRVKTVFLKNDQAQGRYHPHTVVFDSPGSEKMLSRMKKSFEVRLQGHSIDLNTLDITSYLSAPNRINTCNSHLGTVYRIFIDLSDMSWTEIHTAAYNLATHSINKILQAFDPTTGQVHKDEKGQLKVREVVDWPISGSLRRGDEYKDFFKWAAHFNDYHPNVTDENFQIKTASGYYPIRYQTKLFDERSNSLSVFTYAERQFLESYQWLRGLPEFFKPAELFYALGHVYNQTHQQLQYFNLENDKVHCKSATALQKFIPYVKALIRRLPQIQQSIARALSSVEVRKRVYRSETKGYLAEIQQEPLDVERDVVGIEDFLKKPQQQVWQLVVEKNTRIGLTKVYRSWHRIEENTEQRQDNYTILKLKRLLTIHQQISLSELLNSPEITHYLLIVECNTDKILNPEVAEQLFNDLLNVLNNKPDIKIIVITKRSDGLTESFKQKAEKVLNYRFRTTKDAPLTWSDLTSDAQQKLLEKKVDFQGYQVALNQLIDPQQPELTNSIPLPELINKQLVVGGRLPISSGYDENFYIDRTFNHQISIKIDIYYAKQLQRFSDLLASTEQEFKQLCRQHPRSNIHWLKREPGGKVVWQQSQGSLAVLREYIDIHYYPENLNDFLLEAQYHKIILISDTAGMGKTTVLTHLSKQLKQKFPTLWVVRIDLNDHTDALMALTQQRSEKLSSDSAVEFISQKLLMLNTALEQMLFKQCFKYNVRVKVALLLDGFDEISPSYKDIIIDLLQILKKSSVEQLWVTTRPHMKEALEDKLQLLSYTLKPLSPENQITFLTGFWKKELTLPETSHQRLVIYAKALIEKLAISISDKKTKFAGIPLQTRMLADSFKNEVKLSNASAKETLELPDRLDSFGLYERFINKKYSIYQEEKTKAPVSNVAAEEQRKRSLEGLRKVYQRLALQVLFIEESVRLSEADDTQYKFSNEELGRIGIVEIINDRPHFIHRTFAEYFASDFLASQLQEQHQIIKTKKFLLTQILLQEDYRLIREFLNGQLTKSPLSQDALTKYEKYISNLWSEGSLYSEEKKTILHIAYKEDNTNIVNFLLNSLKNNEKTLKSLVLATTKYEETALHQAVASGNWELTKQLLDYVEDNFESNVPGTLIKLLLANASGHKGGTVLHKAVERGYWELVKLLLDYVRDNFESNAPETLKDLVFSTTKEGETVLHRAVASGNWELVRQLFDYVSDNFESSAPGTLKDLVLSTTKDKVTVLHRAVASGNWELVKQLLDYVRDNFESSEPETLISLLLANASGFKGGTILHKAVESGNWKSVKQLLDYVRDNFESSAPGTLKNLILSTAKYKETVLHRAVASGNWELVTQLIDYVRDNFESSAPGTLKDLVFSTTKEGETVLHRAVANGNCELVKQLLDYVRDNFKSGEPGKLISLLLANASGCEEGTILHKAVESGNWKFVTQLLDYVRDNFESSAPGTLKDLVLSTTEDGETVLHRAVARRNCELVKQLLDYVRDNFESSEQGTLISLLLVNASGYEEGTILHKAVESGNWKVVTQLYDYVRDNFESIAPGTLKDLVLSTTKYGETVLHRAVASRNCELVKQLLDYVRDNFESSAPGTLKDLVLSTTKYGETVLHLAVVSGNCELVTQLLDYVRNNFEFSEPGTLISLLLANASRYKRGTILHKAVESGNWKVATQLLDYVRDNFESIAPGTLKYLVLSTTKDGENVLHRAVASGNCELVKQLLYYVRDNFESSEQGTLISLLLVNASGYEEGTIFHKAVESGNWKFVTQLLDYVRDNFESIAPGTLKDLVLSTTKDGETVLHRAVASGNCELVKQLLYYVRDNFESSAPGTLKDLVLSTTKDGETVLHRAVASGNCELVKQVLDYVRDNYESSAPGTLKDLVLSTTKYGETVLHLAVVSGNCELVTQILDYVRDNFESSAPGTLKGLVLSTTNDGETVLHRPLKCRNKELFKLLLFGYLQDEMFNIKNKNGMTALNCAVKLRFWDIAISLLKSGETIGHFSVKQYDELLYYVHNSHDENKEENLKLLKTLKVSITDNELGSLVSVYCASPQLHKCHLCFRVV